MFSQGQTPVASIPSESVADAPAPVPAPNAVATKADQNRIAQLESEVQRYKDHLASLYHNFS